MNPSGQGHLFRNMVLFGRLLRACGLDVTPVQLTDWMEAVRLIDLGARTDFRDATRTVLVRRREDLGWFEEAFDLFWRARAPDELSQVDLGFLVRKATERTRRSHRQPLRGHDAADESGEETGKPEVQKVYTYSATEVLRRKDFAELTPDEAARVQDLLQRMRWHLDTRTSRRKVPARAGPYPDLRRTLRSNLPRGGELVRLARRDRKEKRRPLTLICDVSGSMEPYCRLLLQFIYVITHGLEKVEAFVFGTRLTRITPELRDRDVDQALERVYGEIEDWGGGTRTGEALKDFNYSWSRRVLGQGAAVLIISDGWDRGDIDLLGREMARLQRSVYRLVWLNPLLGSANYEPLTRGMQAALPYIDHFLPVHNLRSLEQLGALLERWSLTSATVGRRWLS